MLRPVPWDVIPQFFSAAEMLSITEPAPGCKPWGQKQGGPSTDGFPASMHIYQALKRGQAPIPTGAGAGQ